MRARFFSHTHARRRIRAKVFLKSVLLLGV